MTTFFVVPSDYPFVRVLVKGAAEIVLERCSHIVGKNGEIKALSHEEKEVINRDVIIANAEKEYRNISIAYKDIILDDFEKVKNLNSDEDIDFLENNLIFVAICGIQDPLRPGIKEAI
jgi:Ca2+-transporting ATPase